LCARPARRAVALRRSRTSEAALHSRFRRVRTARVFLFWQNSATTFLRVEAFAFSTWRECPRTGRASLPLACCSTTHREGGLGDRGNNIHPSREAAAVTSSKDLVQHLSHNSVTDKYHSLPSSLLLYRSRTRSWRSRPSRRSWRSASRWAARRAPSATSSRSPTTRPRSPSPPRWGAVQVQRSSPVACTKRLPGLVFCL
jgi:hypothetical protein